MYKNRGSMKVKKTVISNLLLCSVAIAMLQGCNSSDEQTSVAKNSQVDKSQSTQPNIVVILADDLGYGDLSSLNSASKIQTPALDRIANEGIHFTDAHSNSAVCTPTRYGLLTGRYAFRSRLKDGVTWGYSPALIEEDRTTVASFLKQQGYHTGIVGKWHLGLNWEAKDPTKPIKQITWQDAFPKGLDTNVDFTQAVKGGPNDLGFDYSYIIPASLDMSPYGYLENQKMIELPTEYTSGKSEKVDGRGVFWRAGEVQPNFDFHQVMPEFTAKAVNYIKQRKDGEQPFFLYFPLSAPHTPWLPTKDVEGQSQAGRYGDFVVQTDRSVGAILKVLDDLDLADDTLVIVTSDNGSHWKDSDKAETGHFANANFKGQKADIYEAGHRVPFVARWPQKIGKGSQSEQVIITTDLLATVAGILDKPLPEGAGEDSYNMWPVFVNPALKESIHDYSIHHSLDGFFSIRQGKWKYTPHLGSGGFSVPKSITPEEGHAPGTLYDMENDPEETTNLHSQYPEVVKALSLLLDKAKKQNVNF
jgi:arylsulfatase A-like enzyme